MAPDKKSATTIKRSSTATQELEKPLMKQPTLLPSMHPKAVPRIKPMVERAKHHVSQPRVYPKVRSRVKRMVKLAVQPKASSSRGKKKIELANAPDMTNNDPRSDKPYYSAVDNTSYN